MQDEVFHGARSRERIAPNIYRRRTKTGFAYEVVLRDVDNRQRTRTLAARTQRAALREARGILSERDGGDRIVAAELTIDDLAERDYFPMLEALARSGRRSERNVDDERDRYRLHVKPRLGELSLGDVQPSDLSALIASMRARRPKPYAESTIANVLGVVRGLYRVARRRGYVTRSPVDGLDSAELPKPTPPREGRVLDEAELALLVRHAPAGYRAIVALLAYTGMRIAEALGLRWANVDLLAAELHVREQLQAGRGDRPTRIVDRLKSEASYRTVPIFPAVERELAALLEQRLGELGERGGVDVDVRAIDSEPVFRTRSGRPLSPRNVAQRGVAKAASNAGLGHVTPQMLRKSVCSLAGRRGVDPVEAPQMTGHSPEVWAKFYARSFGKAQRDEARARMLEHGFGTVDDDRPAER